MSALDPAYWPAYALTFIAGYIMYQLNTQARLFKESQLEKGKAT